MTHLSEIRPEKGESRQKLMIRQAPGMILASREGRFSLGLIHKEGGSDSADLRDVELWKRGEGEDMDE